MNKITKEHASLITRRSLSIDGLQGGETIEATLHENPFFVPSVLPFN